MKGYKLLSVLLSVAAPLVDALINIKEASCVKLIED